MPANEQNICFVELASAILEYRKQMFLKVFEWDRMVALIIIWKAVNFNAAEIKNQPYLILFFEIHEKFFVIYLPAKTLLATIEKI